MREKSVPFRDRDEAGRRLAESLHQFEWARPVVIGLARGGIPVAAPIAAALRAPLEVATARKIAAPGRPELGIGAVSAEGPPSYDKDSLRQLGLAVDDMEPVAAREQSEAQRRLRSYRRGMPDVSLRGRDVIVVDDGIATGVTAKAALRDVAEHRPAATVLAAPTCSAEGIRALDGAADQVFCLYEPPEFGSVGKWYRDFHQVSDEEVIETLRRAATGDR